LDKKDSAILNYLFLDGRAAHTSLAKAAKTSRELAAYRLNRLLDKGILLGFNAVIRPQNLGFTKQTIYLRFRKNSEKAESELIKALSKESRVNWLASTGGAYDMGLEITAKDLSELNLVMTKMMNICGDSLSSYLVLNTLDEGPLALNLDGKSIAENDFFLKTIPDFPKTRVTIDETDRKILTMLENNCRTNMVDIGKEVSLTPNAARARIKRLKKAGVISGYMAVPDYSKLGVEWSILLIRLNNFNSETERKFLHFVNRHPFIDYYVKFVGVWNYQISLIAKDASHRRKLLQELRDNLGDCLQDYEVLSVFDQYIYAGVIYKGNEQK
jgi:DNA-binding Lrp family transcriptional regulator